MGVDSYRAVAWTQSENVLRRVSQRKKSLMLTCFTLVNNCLHVCLHTVSQRPLSISLTRVNSSTEIYCSTSLSNPVGMYVYRTYHINKIMAYLSLKNGRVTKLTTAGQIDVTSDHQIREGLGFNVRLFQLGVSDTDLYYCSWSRFISETVTIETRCSNGTIIIVRGEVTLDHRNENCKIFLTDICPHRGGFSKTMQTSYPGHDRDWPDHSSFHLHFHPDQRNADLPMHQSKKDTHLPSRRV